MKTLSKLLFIVMVSFFAVGCATSGPKYTELMPSVSSVPPDSGRIYIYRTSILGAAIQPEVKINGEVVGRAVPNGFFYIDKKPGTYEILTSTEVDRKLSLLLDAGQNRFVRLNISMGFFVGHVYPELVEPEIGQKEIEDCRFTGQK